MTARAALALVATASWLLAAGVARLTSFDAIRATDPLFAFALLTTCACGVVIFVLGSHPRRTAMFKVIVVTAVGLAGLAVIEGAALAGWVNYQRLWDSLTGNWRGPSSEYELDFERAFRRLPNTHYEGRPQGDIAGRFNMPIRSPRTLEFTFNARGFRSYNTVMTRVDVALVGDSFVEGSFVSDGETVADWLGSSIGRSVANLGQSGYGLRQELKVIERDALPMAPRLIVWFFYEGNDLYDDGSFEDTMLYLSQAKGSPQEIARRMGYGRTPFRRASFSTNAFAAVRRLFDPIVPNGAPYHGVFRDARKGAQQLYFEGDATGEWGAYEQGLFEKAKATLIEGKRLSDAAKVRLVIAYVPVKFRVYRDYCEFSADSPCRSWRLWDLPRWMEDFCREAGLEFLDLTGPLQEAARAGELAYVPQDTHWDVRGHQLAARVITSQLLTRKTSPDGAPSAK